jgi:hypothetical protein
MNPEEVTGEPARSRNRPSIEYGVEEQRIYLRITFWGLADAMGNLGAVSYPHSYER